MCADADVHGSFTITQPQYCNSLHIYYIVIIITLSLHYHYTIITLSLQDGGFRRFLELARRGLWIAKMRLQSSPSRPGFGQELTG